MNYEIFTKLGKAANGIFRTADALFDDKKTKKDVFKELIQTGGVIFALYIKIKTGADIDEYADKLIDKYL